MGVAFLIFFGRRLSGLKRIKTEGKIVGEKRENFGKTTRFHEMFIRLEFRNKTNESIGENIKKFTDFHGNTQIRRRIIKELKYC